ncbi:hypothetical protein X777_13646 [Ooceraea biroi]|uniref:Tc1-like transposase DDE domain-containing protein n=1 Tax=Ooceraea biroi TaxID=2015173 RepID=A0A026WYA2_OOCBI|nr:hypothetical protein X777_13646 [Ooceraea biroi]
MRNTHLWADENPRAYHIRNFQQRFSVNLWAGVLNDAIIGPFEMLARLTGQLYVEFLENDLPGLLEDVPLEQRRHMLFQHDGAPPHMSIRLNKETTLVLRFQ